MEEILRPVAAREPKEPVATIERVWFSGDRIFVHTATGEQYSQPLELFPALMEATPQQREDFKVNRWRDSIRWDGIDEDIHISSFFDATTANYDNEVNRLLSRFPWLDMKKFAEYVGMHWTKLARYRYGVWTPSPETLKKIKAAIITLGKEMTAAAIL